MTAELAAVPDSVTAAYWLRGRRSRRRAIFRRPGMPRRPVGCARRSPASAAWRCRADLDRLVLRAHRSRARRGYWAQPPADARLMRAANGKQFKEQLGELNRWSCGAQLFASFQFSPIPTSTVSGTLSGAAACIASRTTAAISSARSSRHFEQQLVVDGQDHPRVRVSRRARRGRRSSRAS